MTVREIQPGDREALVALWCGVFGDPRACVEEFLRLLPEMGGGVAAFEDGRLIGAAYIVTGLQLLEGGKSRRCGYLYAVAADEAYRRRGVGAALSRAAAALGRARGAELICTLPAEDGLYGWYERVLGARCALHRVRRCFDSAPGVPVRPLAPADYLARREALLAGRPHLAPEPAAMAYEAFSLGAYGGGLYALGGGIAAAWVEDGLCTVFELLGEAPEAAASLAAFLGAERAALWQPAPAGEKYLAFVPADLPPDTVGALVFE